MTSAPIGKERKLATVGDGPINSLESSMTLALKGRKVSLPEFVTNFCLNLSTMMAELSSSSSSKLKGSSFGELAVFSSVEMSSEVSFLALAACDARICLLTSVA